MLIQSRLEGRALIASDFPEADRSDEANGRSVDSDDSSDGGSTVDMQDAASAWWSVAHERFSTQQASLAPSLMQLQVYAANTSALCTQSCRAS